MFKPALYGIRVLDLAPGWSAYAARLLGDLGAEVIKIESPSGDPLRGQPEFERLNVNKYGCTLDPSVIDQLARLATISDVVIATPDVNLALLSAANASLIAVTVPSDASAAESIAAAGAIGVALWDRRRTGEGSAINIAKQPAAVAAEVVGKPRQEPASTLAGEVQVDCLPWRLSESPTHIRLPAPALGEHNEYVLGVLLG